jgi:single-strand DNA-binding protein
MQNNTFSGRVAAAPEPKISGDTKICHFTLMSNEYAGKEKAPRVVSIRFTAFGGMGEGLAKALKGDKITVKYRIENNNYTDSATGNQHYGFNFIVEGFEFDAPGKLRREMLNNNGGDNEGDDIPF